MEIIFPLPSNYRDKRKLLGELSFKLIETRRRAGKMHLELNLSMKLTHDFKRYGIAFSGPFRVDGTTTVGSYCIHFNVLQNQALSAHDDALGGVLLKKVALKRLNLLAWSV